MPALPDSAALPSSFAELHLILIRHLSDENLEAAGDLFARLVEIPVWMEFGLDRLSALIKKDGRRVSSDAFLRMLLLREDITFGHLKIIARLLEFGVHAGQLDRIVGHISAREAQGRLPPPRFSNFDLMKRFNYVGQENLQLLMRLKYLGHEDLNFRNLLNTSKILAGRVEMPPNLANRLLAVNRLDEIPRDRWMRDLEAAFALDHIMADRWGDMFPQADIRALFALLDVQALRRGFRQFSPSRGTLVVFFHGGFVNLLSLAFVWGTGAKGRVFSVISAENHFNVKDPRTALYQGVRAIEDGYSIFMAPDGLAGKLNAKINVLGLDVPMAEGAPFIAYETRCETIWIAAERRGDRFFPHFVSGPVRRDGEKYRAFRERWFAFYEDQITRLLTGPPRNLPLRSQWARLFSDSFDPHQRI